mmetsp:Transcript_4665/g.13339  ORF Transcript_4665/g.13339 Transcript_4665/m.13339 type:complete len:203 (-) Transcript_4665:783-1391(-)
MLWVHVLDAEFRGTGLVPLPLRLEIWLIDLHVYHPSTPMTNDGVFHVKIESSSEEERNNVALRQYNPAGGSDKRGVLAGAIVPTWEARGGRLAHRESCLRRHENSRDVFIFFTRCRLISGCSSPRLPRRCTLPPPRHCRRHCRPPARGSQRQSPAGTRQGTDRWPPPPRIPPSPTGQTVPVPPGIASTAASTGPGPSRRPNT